MRTILGIHNVRLADSSSEHGLEARDHGVLGHPAQVALLAVIGVAFVGGILHGQDGKVVLVHHGKQAVCGLTGIGALQHDVTHIHGIRHIGQFHDTGGEEGGTGLVYRGNTGIVLCHEGVYITVYGAKIATLVPAVRPLAVAVALQESTHVVRRSEFVVQGDEFIVLGSYVFGRGLHFIHNILDVAGGLLAEVFLVGVVELLDVGLGHHHGRILREVGVGGHDKAHLSGGIVLCNGAAAFHGVHIGSGVEKAHILLVEAVAANGVLQVVAKQDTAAGFVLLDILHEVAYGGSGERTVLVVEDTHAAEHRGNIVTHKHVDLLLLAHADTGILDGGDDQVAVYQVVPGHVAGLALGLLAGSGLAGEHFPHVRELLYL